MLTARRGRSHHPLRSPFLGIFLVFSLLRAAPLSPPPSPTYAREERYGCYPYWARVTVHSHTANTPAPRDLTCGRLALLAGEGQRKGGGGRVGDRPANQPLGYAGYGQSGSARSQVYPGTPTLAVAPSRIDFNPSSSSGVNKGWITRAIRTATIRRGRIFIFSPIGTPCHCVKLPYNRRTNISFPSSLSLSSLLATACPLLSRSTLGSPLRPCLRPIGNFRLSLQGTFKLPR